MPRMIAEESREPLSRLDSFQSYPYYGLNLICEKIGFSNRGQNHEYYTEHRRGNCEKGPQDRH